MPRRHREDGRRSRLPRAVFVVAATLALAAGSLLAGAGAADAATTDEAQISVTGLVDSHNPTGGDSVGIHPGDSVRFTASALPTQAVKSLASKLGLGGPVGDLLDGLTSFHVIADFSSLPGGKADTELYGSRSATFRLSTAKTYTFSWKAESVGLLSTTPIRLNGDQLKKLGIELNADNDYVGKIVVSKNPPKGGLGIQVPPISVKPKVGRLNLPKVKTPGTTVHVPTPNLPSVNDGGGKPSKGKPGATKHNSGNTTGGTTKTGSYQLPGLSVPDQVVPHGSGGGSSSGLGGYYSTLPDGSSSLSDFSNSNGGSMHPLGAKPAAASTPGKKAKTVDLAGDPTSASPSSQWPVILAILAIIALALVAGTYARLYLLRKPPTA